MPALLLSLLLGASAAAAELKSPAGALTKIREQLALKEPYKAYLLVHYAVDRYPDDIAIQKAYQLIVHNRGDYEDSLSKYYWRWDKEKTPLSAYLLARIDDDRVRVRDTVRQGLAADPRHAGLLALQAQIRMEDLAASGKYEAALKLVDASSELRAMEPALYRQIRSSLLMNLGKLDEAWTESVLALAAEPLDAWTRLLRIAILSAQGDRNKTAEEISRTYDLGDFAAVHALTAERELGFGNKAGAEEHFRQALARPRDALNWHSARMNAHYGLGDWTKAAQEARVCLELDPNDQLAGSLLAADLRRRGKVEEAEKITEELYARNPNFLANIAAMGYLHFARGRYREAEKFYTRALELAPGDYNLWVARGSIRSHLDDIAGAERDYKRADALAFWNEPVDRNYGRLLMNAGRWEECRNRFASLARNGYDDYDALLGLARCSIGDKRFEAGLAVYELAKKKVATVEDKRQIASNLDWARAELAAHEAKYPADSLADAVPVTVVDSLADTPEAAFYTGKTSVGTAWNDAPLLDIPGQDHFPRLLAWHADGSRLVIAGDKAINEVAASTTAFRAVRRVEKPKPGPRPIWRSIQRATLEPRAGKLYDVETVREYGKYGAWTVNAVDLKTGAAKELFRRETPIDTLWADPRKPRLLLFGGGNVELDLTTGKTRPLETIGCELPLDIRPGADEAACVSAENRSDGQGELVLYDLAANKKTFLGVIGDQPAWSPDGKSLAYVWRDRELRVRDRETGAVRAYRFPLKLDPLLTAQRAMEPARWSSDGRFVYFTVGKPVRTKEEDASTQRYSVIVDTREKKAWLRGGELHNFAWRPSPPAKAP